jgi:L-fuconolactonase
MAKDLEAWLKLTQEEAIDPDLPIIDAHHHLWDRPGEPYLLKEFLHDMEGGHHITQTVFVEAGSRAKHKVFIEEGGHYRRYGPREMRYVGETEFIQGIAAQSASGQYGPTLVAAGIVSFADLGIGAEVDEVLKAHVAASPNRFRGIRYKLRGGGRSPDIMAFSKTKGVMADARTREGFACLQKYGLTYDSSHVFTQLPDIVDLAKAFPGITVVVDHIGCILGTGPYAGKRDEVFQEWKGYMKQAAGAPNIVVKLGGLGMERCGFGWHEMSKPPTSAELAKDMAPWLNTTIDLVGPDRCMFVSNFPPDKVSYSYTVMWNAFKRLTERYSKKERAALFHDTAARVYRLATDYEL